MVERRERGVFHAAPVVVVNGDLPVFGPWIRHADFLFEELHHAARVPEQAGCVGELVRGGPELKWEFAVTILRFLEFTGNKGDEVVHVRFVLEPVESGESGFFFGFRKLFAVREGDHAVGY